MTFLDIKIYVHCELMEIEKHNLTAPPTTEKENIKVWILCAFQTNTKFIKWLTKLKSDSKIFPKDLHNSLEHINSLIYNLGHNVLGLFDVLPNFSFTTSETNHDY